MSFGYVRKLLSAALGVILITGGFLQSQEMIKQKEEEVIRLTNDVRKKILMLSDYGPFDSISFGIGSGDKGYTVILKGYASRPLLKDSAEKAIQKLEAVDAVDNQIEILPVSKVDEDIRFRAYAAIYGNTTLSRYSPHRGTPIYGSTRALRNTLAMGISTNPPTGIHPISIIVKNGHIILEGVVDNEGDKTTAGLVANQVSGVFSATNNLAVLQEAPKKKK